MKQTPGILNGKEKAKRAAKKLTRVSKERTDQRCKVCSQYKWKHYGSEERKMLVKWMVGPAVARFALAAG